MTCVKTGCHIYIIPYGIFAYGDAHEVGGAFFFRLVQYSDKPLFTKLHYEVNNYDSCWDRHAQVSTLVARSEDVIFQGYDGRDTSEFPYAVNP